MKQGTTTIGFKKCCRCQKSYNPEMFRVDPQKKDGRYPSCRGCTARGGWASLVRVIKRVPCEGCGVHFTPRHNKGRAVRHCSRACGVRHKSWVNEANALWGGDDVGYSTAHDRVRRTRGAAAEHGCVDCGNDAAQWSLNRQADLLRFEDGMPYSPDPKDYEPRCVSCHKLYDLAALA